MKKTYKILLVSPLPPPIGGIASWTEAYMKYIKNIGIECRLVNSAVLISRNLKGKVNYFEELKRLLQLRKKNQRAIKK